MVSGLSLASTVRDLSLIASPPGSKPSGRLSEGLALMVPRREGTVLLLGSGLTKPSGRLSEGLALTEARCEGMVLLPVMLGLPVTLGLQVGRQG